MKQIRAVIGKIIIIVCIWIAVLLAGSLLYSRFILKENPPHLLNYIPVTVLSGSMEPTFSRGDILFIKQQDNYQIDDVVTYEEKGVLVTHRIVSLTDQGYVFQGDANNVTDDHYIQENQILGKMEFIIPCLGNIGLWLKTPAGIAVLFIATGVYFIRHIKRDRKAEE